MLLLSPKWFVVAAVVSQPKKSCILAVRLRGGGYFINPEWLDGSLGALTTLFFSLSPWLLSYLTLFNKSSHK